MAHYLIQASYTAGAAKTLVEHPQSRKDVIEKSCASLGGRLHSFFFAFGKYDVVAIAEFPSNDAAAAFALAASAGGAVSRFQTSVLMTPEEAMSGMKLAKKVSYAAPK